MTPWSSGALAHEAILTTILPGKTRWTWTSVASMGRPGPALFAHV